MTQLGIWPGEVPSGYIGDSGNIYQQFLTWVGVLDREVPITRSRGGEGQLDASPQSPSGTLDDPGWVIATSRQAIADGYIASLQVQPKYGTGQQRRGIPYLDIANGTYDNLILQGFAELKRETEADVLYPFEVHSECNIQHPNPAAQPYSGDPDEYAPFAMRIHELAIEAGVRNRLLFVMSMTRGGWTGTTWRTWMNINGANDLSDVMDVLAVDGYTQPISGQKKEFSFITQPVIQVARSLGLYWAVMETGAQPDSGDVGYKPAWYGRVVDWLEQEGEDCYCVVFNTSDDGPGSWMPQDNGGGPGTAAGNASLNAFIAMCNDPVFDGTGGPEPPPDPEDPPDPPDPPEEPGYPTPSSLASLNSNADQATYTTPSFTPSANRVLLAEIISRGGTEAPSAGPSGWTLLDSQAVTNLGWGGVYGKLGGASPSSQTVSATWSSARTGVHIAVVEISGGKVDDTIAAAFEQNEKNFTTSGASSLSIALAAPDPDNRLISFWSHRENEPTTPRQDWVTIASGSFSAPISSNAVTWLPGQVESTASASWAAVNAPAVGFAFEMVNGNPPVTPPPPPTATWSVTKVVDEAVSTNLSAYSFTPTATPEAERIVVALFQLSTIGGTNITQTPVIDAWGLTWVTGEIDYLNAAAGVSICWAYTGADTLDPDTFDVTFANTSYNQTGLQVVVLSLDGPNVEDPVFASALANGSGTALSISAPLPEDGLVVALFGGNLIATSTPGAGWTEAAESTITSPSRMFTVVYSETASDPNVTLSEAASGWRGASMSIQPNPTLRAKVSWIELEATSPAAASRGLVSQVLLEAPDVLTRGKVSFIELEARNPPGEEDVVPLSTRQKLMRRLKRQGVILRDPRPRP